MSENGYHTADGKPCSLGHLCRNEPEWAEQRIRQLRAENEKLMEDLKHDPEYFQRADYAPRKEQLFKDYVKLEEQCEKQQQQIDRLIKQRDAWEFVAMRTGREELTSDDLTKMFQQVVDGTYGKSND